jgi:hypothetical protein
MHALLTNHSPLQVRLFEERKPRPNGLTFLSTHYDRRAECADRVNSSGHLHKDSMTSLDHFLHDLPASRLQWTFAGPR